MATHAKYTVLFNFNVVRDPRMVQNRKFYFAFSLQANFDKGLNFGQGQWNCCCCCCIFSKVAQSFG